MRIGILGMGSIGRRHYNNAEALDHFVSKFDPIYSSPNRAPVISWADAVVVASPSKQHGPDLTDVLDKQKHVLVEKPFGYDCPPYLAGYLMGARSRSPHLIIATGFNLRFHACVKKAKELIPELGEILSASFVVRQKTMKEPYLRDGIIRNWCSHEVDLAHYLLGEGTVSHCVAPIDEHGNDSISADIIMEFDSVSGNVYLEADYFTDPEQRYFWIDGTKATVYVDLVQRNVFMHDKQANKRSQVLAAMDTYDENYMEEMKTFIRSIECGQHLAPLATGEDGVRALYTVMAARQKAGLDG